MATRRDGAAASAEQLRKDREKREREEKRLAERRAEAERLVRSEDARRRSRRMMARLGN